MRLFYRLLLPALSWGAEPAVSEILNRTAENYRNYRALHFEVTQTTGALGDPYRTGVGAADIHLTLERPGRLRLRYRTPLREFLVVNDGETQWLSVPSHKAWSRQRLATRFDSADEAGNGLDPITDIIQSLVNRYAALPLLASHLTLEGRETLKLDGRKVSCFFLKFTAPDGRGKREYWIDESRYLVLKEREVRNERMNDRPTELTTTTIWKLADLNPTLPDDTFAFTPPPKFREDADLVMPTARRVLLFIGKQAPDFTLNDTEGNPVRLSSLRGKVVLLDFWASWCPPCREELPAIEKLHREYSDRNLVVLGIDDEPSGTARTYRQRNRLTFPTLEDPKHQVFRLYGTYAIPTIVVIDPNGIVVKQFTGSHDDKALRAALAAAGNR